MKDLTNVTETEMDAMSIEPESDAEELIILNENDYYEENGIRFFQKPLRVSFVSWGNSTLDCNSIVKNMGGSQIYVFATAVNEAYNADISKFFFNKRCHKMGYGIFCGFSSVEVNAIDLLM